MASEFYVAEDGSIHRHPVTEVSNTRDRTNTYAPAAAVNAQARTTYRPIHQVSEGRKVWFWIISIIMSLLIAVGVTQGFGAEVYGSDGGFAATIGPFVVFVGALAGSILYGIFCAKSVDYNLWAYILSPLSSVGGIVVTWFAVALISYIVGIAVVIICSIAMMFFYILVIGFVIAIICGLAGGS